MGIFFLLCSNYPFYIISFKFSSAIKVCSSSFFICFAISCKYVFTSFWILSSIKLHALPPKIYEHVHSNAMRTSFKKHVGKKCAESFACIYYCPVWTGSYSAHLIRISPKLKDFHEVLFVLIKRDPPVLRVSLLGSKKKTLWFSHKAEVICKPPLIFTPQAMLYQLWQHGFPWSADLSSLHHILESFPRGLSDIKSHPAQGIFSPFQEMSNLLMGILINKCGCWWGSRILVRMPRIYVKGVPRNMKILYCGRWVPVYSNCLIRIPALLEILHM